MKNILRYHLSRMTCITALHGQHVFIQLQFILRRSPFKIIRELKQATFLSTRTSTGSKCVVIDGE